MLKTVISYIAALKRGTRCTAFCRHAFSRGVFGYFLSEIIFSLVGEKGASFQMSTAEVAMFCPRQS